MLKDLRASVPGIIAAASSSLRFPLVVPSRLPADRNPLTSAGRSPVTAEFFVVALDPPSDIVEEPLYDVQQEALSSSPGTCVFVGDAVDAMLILTYTDHSHQVWPEECT
jgi:hypothetical protein